MDFLSLAKLLPEFLGMLKGNEEGGEGILKSAGNWGVMQNLLSKSGQLTKYLPLLPLVSKFSKQGLSGLLSSSEDVSLLLDLISQSENKYAKMLRNIDAESIVKILPLISEFFEKKQDKKDVLTMQAVYKPEKVKTIPHNPLSCISEIADKDILFALNRHISKYTD